MNDDIKMNRKALIEVLDCLKEAQERWCAKEVDDAEEMWSDIPEMLDAVVPKMEKALAGTQEVGAVPRVVDAPWLPIDTAPKDGTHILILVLEDNGTGEMEVVRWSTEWSHWRTDSWDDGGYDAELRPTHWMTLPPLPSAQETP